MFETAKKELAAWWWFIRSKFGSSLALCALPFATYALTRARRFGERDRFARFMGSFGFAFIAAARFVTPSPILDAADQAAAIQTQPRRTIRGRGR